MNYFYRIVCLIIAFGTLSCSGGGGGDSANTEIIVSGANAPAGIAALPDGRVLYTELHTGSVRVVENGAVRDEPFYTFDVTQARNERLLGLTADRNFNDNHFLYFFVSSSKSSGNRVVRLRDLDGVGVDPETLIDNIPAGGHDGGRIVSANDGTLFISTGDAGAPETAQEVEHLGGKVLRINRDGTIPNNPFPGTVFAVGFRNPFGLALDRSSGALYTTDNGPECDDELNLVTGGENYGWGSNEQCGESNFTAPIERFSSPIAPTGAVVHDGTGDPTLAGNVFMGDFLTGSLRQFIVEDGVVSSRRTVLEGEIGPLIDVAQAPDGSLLLATSDAIIRIGVEEL